MNIQITTYENGKVTTETTSFTISPEMQEILDAAAAEDRITRPKIRGLSSSWCSEKRRRMMGLDEADECEFYSYPEDGQCHCGLHKHHVHCIHGYVTQIG
mgnify:CR=1 FL=1